MQRRALFVLGSTLFVFALLVTCDDNLNVKSNNVLSKKINNDNVFPKSYKVISSDDKYNEKENVLKGVTKSTQLNRNYVTQLPAKSPKTNVYDGLFKDAKNGECNLCGIQFLFAFGNLRKNWNF